MVAGQDGSLPEIFTKTNKHGVPTGALFLQAIIVSILSLSFVFMPTVNASFWLLSIITAQLAMIVYAVLFSAAIKLHHHKSEVKRHFKVPFGDVGIWITAIFGIIVCGFAIIVGFIPPKKFLITNIFVYELSLILGMLFLSSIPLFLYHFTNRTKKT